MISLLLSSNSSPSAPDRSGNTALHYAVMAGDVQACRALLEGAEKAWGDVRNDEGKNPLDCCRNDDVGKRPSEENNYVVLGWY